MALLGSFGAPIYSDGPPPIMARWLVKEEPGHYSFLDLVRDRRTTWDGIHNALALRHLKAMAPGDEVLYYHSGTERAIVGIAKVAGSPRPDPKDTRGSWLVDLRPVRPLRRAIPLSALKADPRFADFVLVRMGRLTVMPVPDELWPHILQYERA